MGDLPWILVSSDVGGANQIASWLILNRFKDVDLTSGDSEVEGQPEQRAMLGDVPRELVWATS